VSTLERRWCGATAAAAPAMPRLERTTHLAVTLGAAFAETLASLSAAGHVVVGGWGGGEGRRVC
jgi:hypothetical protein